MTNRDGGFIQMWEEESFTPPITISVTEFSSWSLWVTMTDDIYLDNNNNAIDQWTLNSPNKVATFYTGGVCYDIFIDVNDSLYCALYFAHQVIKRSLNSSDNQTTIVGGTGCPGFATNMFYNPCGIYVDTNFNLFTTRYYA